MLKQWIETIVNRRLDGYLRTVDEVTQSTIRAHRADIDKRLNEWITKSDKKLNELYDKQDEHHAEQRKETAESIERHTRHANQVEKFLEIISKTFQRDSV